MAVSAAIVCAVGNSCASTRNATALQHFTKQAAAALSLGASLQGEPSSGAPAPISCCIAGTIIAKLATGTQRPARGRDQRYEDMPDSAHETQSSSRRIGGPAAVCQIGPDDRVRSSKVRTARHEDPIPLAWLTGSEGSIEGTAYMRTATPSASSTEERGGSWRNVAWFFRATDYILGRNTLIGVASLTLLAIAGFATWHGMRDFIVGVSTTPGQGQQLPGGLSVSNDVLVIVVVSALTFLMWLMLRETFGAAGPHRRWPQRLITFPLYLFLAIWSIGFGYGFWWSLISGEEATRTGLAGLQEDARDASAVIAARLDAVKGQLDSVVSWSESQMAREETSGGSCGVPSGAGKGPLYNARRAVRDSVITLRDGMTRSWLDPVTGEVGLLRKTASDLAGTTVEERQKAFEAKASEIRGRARNIAARSNQLGRSTAAEMRAIAATVAVAPNRAGFSCYDPTLAERLTQAATQAEQPAELKLREAVFSEGPAGVANAVKNLWRNIGTYTSGLLSLVFTGQSTIGRTDTGEPITGRDLIALLATIGVDLGLLALAILNPPREPPSIRPSGALRRQINEAIDTAIASAGVDREWVRKHFIHHQHTSYLVIPNLYSAGSDDGQDEDEKQVEARRALAMNQLAGVLSDLDLVESASPGRRPWGWHLIWSTELDRLKAEERRTSSTDLSKIRKEWRQEEGLEPEHAGHSERPIRNHGLFSKAERAMEFADWSEKARTDIEVFRLVDAEGLTPLLMVLNEPRAGGKQISAPAEAPRYQLAARPQPAALPPPRSASE
jgi:hypothetical protein